MAQVTPGDVARVLHSTVPLLAHVGMEVLEARPGAVRTRLPFLAQSGNHIGTAYAGVLFSFLESTGGALILLSLDVSRWIPVVVEGTIRYLRPVTGPVESALALPDDERDRVHAMLDADPKSRWTLPVAAVAGDGRVACEAEIVYRFRAVG